MGILENLGSATLSEGEYPVDGGRTRSSVRDALIAAASVRVELGDTPGAVRDLKEVAA
jgi:hypothetical protein